MVMMFSGCNEESVNVMTESDTPVDGDKAKVVNVVDGDTIDVAFENGNQERVRLILVDTPETKHPRLGEQPFGKEATIFTEEWLEGKEVLLEYDVSERDRYGRVLAYIWVDGINFNRLLIEEGLARVAIFPPDIKYVDEFEQVQAEAREEKKGIWSIEDYVHDKGFQSDLRTSPPMHHEQHHRDRECNIKGNINSKKEKIYHLPDGQYYDRVIPEMWFCSPEEAKKAGFRPSKR